MMSKIVHKCREKEEAFAGNPAALSFVLKER
jgi:hypothetical protein